MMFIVRHGETDYNKELRIQGQLEVSLNATGREEARLSGLELAHRLPAAKRKVRILSSDNGRAKETATIIMEQLRGNERDVDLVLEPLLRERDLGVFQGQLWSDLAERCEKFHTLPEPKFVTVLDELMKQEEGGESKEAFVERGMQCVQFLLKEVEQLAEDSSLIIVSHGLTIRCLLSLMFFCGDANHRVDPSTWAYPRVDIKNGSITTFHVHGESMSLGSLNETHHLPAKEPRDRYAMLAKKK